MEFPCLADKFLMLLDQVTSVMIKISNSLLITEKSFSCMDFINSHKFSCQSETFLAEGKSTNFTFCEEWIVTFATANRIIKFSYAAVKQTAFYPPFSFKHKCKQNRVLSLHSAGFSKACLWSDRWIIFETLNSPVLVYI